MAPFEDHTPETSEHAETPPSPPPKTTQFNLQASAGRSCDSPIRYSASRATGSAKKLLAMFTGLSSPAPPMSFDRPQLHGYRIGKTLGKGKFGKVRTAVDKRTGEVVAIKQIDKPSAPMDLMVMRREVELMRDVDHPNVVRLYKVVETDDALFLVMEQLDGGEVFDRVSKYGPYPEERAREVTRRLLEALVYLHHQGICHRDLKPENILLASDDDVSCKISDFGLSRSFAAEADEARTPTVMRSPKGTVGYAAPEILRQSAYSSQVDLWSLGVVVFILLSGYEPFHGETEHEIQQKTLRRNFYFHQANWGHVSGAAKDFVSSLLTSDPKHRPTAAEALEHRWLTGRARSLWERLGAFCRCQAAQMSPANALGMSALF